MTADTGGDLPMSPFGTLLGIELIDSADGRARCRLALRPEHRNNGGRIHGGVVASLADTAAGMAVRGVRPEGTQSATTDLSIAFLRPPLGDSLEAEAEVIQAGRRLLRTEITVYSGGKPVARCSATFMLT